MGQRAESEIYTHVAALLEHHNYLNCVQGGAILPREDTETTMNAMEHGQISNAMPKNGMYVTLKSKIHNWDEQNEDGDAE
jgi:hypothetical protein